MGNVKFREKALKTVKIQWLDGVVDRSQILGKIFTRQPVFYILCRAFEKKYALLNRQRKSLAIILQGLCQSCE